MNLLLPHLKMALLVLGIFKNPGSYKTYIDINGIADLKKTNVTNNEVTLGMHFLKSSFYET